MNTLRAACVVSWLLLAAACASTQSDPQLVELHHTGEDCICGTPDGDFHGCHCEDCLLNGGNPLNPACTCLPLRVGEKLRPTYASFSSEGGGGRSSVGGSLMGMDEIKLAGKSGKLRGEVIEDDGSAIRFRTPDGQVQSYTYEDLDQRVVYLLLKGRTNKDDGSAELRLANFANEIGLYAHARRHYGYAVAADPSLQAEVDEGFVRLRANAAKSELELAEEARTAGDDAEAREHLLNVVREFPDEAAAGEAMYRLNAMNVERLGAEKAALLAEAGPEVWDELEPAVRLFESASEKNQKALASGNRSTFRAALADCGRARKALERARGAIASAPVAESCERQVITLEVEIHLNLASVELAAGNFTQALDGVNAALALDPENEKALQQRARIESLRSSAARSQRPARGSDDPGSWTYEYHPGTGIIHRDGYGIRGSYGGWSRGGSFQGRGSTFR